MTGLPVKINICSVYTWFPPISFNRKDTEVNKHTNLSSALGMRMCCIQQLVIECVHSLLLPWMSMSLYWYYLKGKQKSKPWCGSKQNYAQFLENKSGSRKRGQCLRFGNRTGSEENGCRKHHLDENAIQVDVIISLFMKKQNKTKSKKKKLEHHKTPTILGKTFQESETSKSH